MKFKTIIRSQGFNFEVKLSFNKRKEGLNNNSSSKYTQVHLLQSSTMVRKYSKPLIEGIENGPQISQWTRSKVEEQMLFSLGKGSLFCLSKGQTVQTRSFLSQKITSGIIELIKCNLDEEGWPILLCHKTEFETVMLLHETRLQSATTEEGE